MIRIRKPEGGPVILVDKGAKARRALCAAYSRSPKAYRDGGRTFGKFNARIYSHATVKQALLEAQHGKCCFCESKVTHIAYGETRDSHLFSAP